MLPQILLAETNLKILYRQLLKWLKTPVSEFAQTPLKAREELGDVESQTFSMEFGLRSDLIINIGHSACTISYKTNGISGECIYIVDQSCIQTFIDGLGNCFSSQRET